MDTIFDSKRAWNWGTLLLSSGLAIASLFTTAGTGILAVLIGMGGSVLSRVIQGSPGKRRADNAVI